MKTPRIYLDTSVFGGCFDPEFARESNQLMEEVRAGRFRVILSVTTLGEMENAPEKVRLILDKLPTETIEYVSLTIEMTELRDAYIATGIVGSASLRDAEHIAAATVGGVDMVISWNFKHIVHYEKIAGYNAVNLLHGYRSLNIYSPKEVVTP